MNYSRPWSCHVITLSSYVGKLFERALQLKIRAFAEKEGVLDVEQEGILDAEQEGFRKRKSTVRLLY